MKIDISKHIATSVNLASHKILITGGLGFIGSHLVEKLKGHVGSIDVIDNLSTSCISPDHEILNDDSISFHQMDLSNLSQSEKLILDELIKKASIVFHLAGPVGVRYIDNNAKDAIRSLITQNTYLFDRVEHFKKKLIFASSSEVYGECLDGLETSALSIASPHSLRGGYACGKLMSEFLLKTYSFDHVILRFANVTGTRQLAEHGMVLPNFLSKAMKGEDLVIHNDGMQTRSFCDVRDAIAMITRVSFDENIKNEIFNIANSSNYISMKKMAELVIKLTETKASISYIDFSDSFSKNSHEITHRKVNDSKIAKLYKAQFTNEDIIKSIIKHGSKK